MDGNAVHPSLKDGYEDITIEAMERRYSNFSRNQLILEIRILKIENKSLRSDVNRLMDSLIVYKEMPCVEEQIKYILKNLKTASELSENLVKNSQKDTRRENVQSFQNMDIQRNKRKLDSSINNMDSKRRLTEVQVKEELEEADPLQIENSSEIDYEYDSSGYLDQPYWNSYPEVNNATNIPQNQTVYTEDLNEIQQHRKYVQNERNNMSPSFEITNRDRCLTKLPEQTEETYVQHNSNIEQFLSIDMPELNQEQSYKQENTEYKSDKRNWDDDDDEENEIIFREGLKSILRETIEGKQILKVTGIFQEVHRRNLTKIVLNYLNKNYAINSRIPVSIFERAAEEIEKTFPNECRLTYFVPPKKKTKTTPSIGASGKLWAKYYNLKRASKALQNEIILQGESQTVDGTNNEDLTIGVDEKTAFQFLQRNIEITPKLFECWKKTFKIRKEYLDKQEMQQYFNEIPSLKTNKGYLLLLEDFDRLYSDKSYKLYQKWDIISKKIVHLCKLKNLIPRDSTEMHTDFGIVTLLPQLFQPVTTRKVNSITRIKRNNAQETFFYIISDASMLHTALEERKKEASQNSKALQPFMTAVVENSRLVSTYVVLENALYQTDSVIHCLDTCFKLFFSLNAQYPLECKPVWMFIQNYIYEIETKFDKIYTTVRCAISDMDKVAIV